MVDIMDMGDIFREILYSELFSHVMSNKLAKRLIREVSDFVEAEQTIACANCRGYKFKNIKSWNR